MAKNNKPTILSIDTSCDETSCAVTSGLAVLSNVVWSQSKIHSKFGGVVPSTARREHERKIFWVVNKAVNTAKIEYNKIDAFSVTVGPGLAIALGVGINFTKNLAAKFVKPLIAVNHLEGHVLSPFVRRRNQNQQTYFIPKDFFPAFSMVVSGGNTLLIYAKKIGEYKTLAQTLDDALGESLDKSARLLGLGYPGGAVLERFAKLGDPKSYSLPIPMMGRENESCFSYSGLKTAFYRLVESSKQNKKLSKKQICNLASSYQKTAFDHLIRVSKKVIANHQALCIKYLFVGGGVAANVELRKRIRSMCKDLSINPLFPYSNKLYGDNAAMIGIAAYFKYLKKDFTNVNKIDRLPNLKIDQKI